MTKIIEVEDVPNDPLLKEGSGKIY